MICSHSLSNMITKKLSEFVILIGFIQKKSADLGLATQMMTTESTRAMGQLKSIIVPEKEEIKLRAGVCCACLFGCSERCPDCLMMDV